MASLHPQCPALWGGTSSPVHSNVSRPEGFSGPQTLLAKWLVALSLGRCTWDHHRQEPHVSWGVSLVKRGLKAKLPGGYFRQSCPTPCPHSCPGHPPSGTCHGVGVRAELLQAAGVRGHCLLEALQHGGPSSQTKEALGCESGRVRWRAGSRQDARPVAGRPWPPRGLGQAAGPHWPQCPYWTVGGVDTTVSVNLSTLRAYNRSKRQVEKPGRAGGLRRCRGESGGPAPAERASCQQC